MVGRRLADRRGARHRGARELAWSLGRHVDKGWKELPDVLRHVFGLHGIEAKHWEVIRRTAFREVNGLTYLTPDRIADLPNAAIRPLAQERVSALSAAGKLTPTAERRILDERVYGAARLVFLRVSA